MRKTIAFVYVLGVLCSSIFGAEPLEEKYNDQEAKIELLERKLYDLEEANKQNKQILAQLTLKNEIQGSWIEYSDEMSLNFSNILVIDILSDDEVVIRYPDNIIETFSSKILNSQVAIGDHGTNYTLEKPNKLKLPGSVSPQGDYCLYDVKSNKVFIKINSYVVNSLKDLINFPLKPEKIENFEDFIKSYNHFEAIEEIEYNREFADGFVDRKIIKRVVYGNSSAFFLGDNLVGLKIYDSNLQLPNIYKTDIIVENIYQKIGFPQTREENILIYDGIFNSNIKLKVTTVNYSVTKIDWYAHYLFTSDQFCSY